LEKCRRILPVITKKLRTLLVASKNIPALFYNFLKIEEVVAVDGRREKLARPLRRALKNIRFYCRAEPYSSGKFFFM